MELEKFDGYKHASEKLCSLLSINKTFLAGMLGVTDRSLTEWEGMGAGEETPKSKRLVMLYNVVRTISKEFPMIPHKAYREVLENSRIVFDPDDEEDGSISLMNLVVTEPDEKFWFDATKSSVKSYLKFLKDKGHKVEAYRPVQIAK